MKHKKSEPGRRKFIRQSGLMAGTLMFYPAQGWAVPDGDINDKLNFSIFSKHLQFLDYADMADAAAELGFDGIDLTVRRKGHVEPERVEDELPPAIEAIKKVGLRHDLMASDVNNAEDPTNRKVLETAAKLGVKYYRLGYLRFLDDMTIPDRLEELNGEMKKLAAYNNDLGIAGTYQNHSGIRVGAQIWDLWHLLKGIDRSQLGCQYDIRHAVVEGGQSWENGLKLIRPHINSIVLKDFVWGKPKNGRWGVKNVPLGQGMVDFVSYFKLLKMYRIDVPVSIHYEYDLGGVEHGDRQLKGMKAPEIFKMMKKDLQFAKQMWQQA
ncbi:MAG: sugar phosphate isomerase/epimerase [Saprospiraceae bacterium]|nr:sugar phosphate isomerase/epimerase [Saprospiraceae bacterium]